MPVDDAAGDSPREGDIGEDQPVFHRLRTGTQSVEDAAKQTASGELWGRVPRQEGMFLAVKAYHGPLPAGREGIEFTTAVPPTHGYKRRDTGNGIALWVEGYDERIEKRREGGEDVAVIKIKVIRTVP